MNRRTAPRVGFLFGAGVSLAAGMPSTQDLTDLVVEGRVARAGDSHYYLTAERSAGARPESIDYISLVITLVDALRTEVDAFYSRYPARRANYEDIYYLAVQIADAMSGEYENPALRLLADRLTPVVAPFYSSLQPPNTSEEMLLDAGNETVRYVEDVVWRSLARRPTDADTMSVAVEAVEDEELEGVDCFTLNHDVVLEQRLRRDSIPFVDGFADPVGSICRWNLDSLQHPNARTRVVKLHGSIDWCFYGGYGLARTIDGDLYHVSLPDGSYDPRSWGEGHPALLCGTFNKMLEYLRSPFLDLHLVFREALGSIRLLVVSGYGFGDKGVNSRLWEWMSGGADRRMIVVHADAEALARGARGLIRKSWDQWGQAGRLLCVPKWFEEATWKEIKGAAAL